jgi:cysteine-rich repeat protein
MSTDPSNRSRRHFALPARIASAFLVSLLAACGANSPESPGQLSCSVSPTSGTSPLVVAFTAQAKAAEDTDFRWVFSDGTAGTGATVTRTLLTGGAYSGRVTLSTSGETCTTPTVAIGAPVRVSCSANPAVIIAPDQVRFHANPSGGNGTFSYAWTFGDGGTSTEQDPTHAYQTPGTYPVKVTASSSGFSATCDTSVTAFKTGLQVSCAASPKSGAPPLAVNFSASASGDNGEYTYAWSFGDGTFSREQSPTHTYNSIDVFTAQVSVSGAASGGSCAQTISLGSICGDGKVQGKEACDDGNKTGGDGCTSCRIDPGFSCSGSPSTCTTTCGDGLIAGAEICDDGNKANKDGCSSACLEEHGFVCSGAPSACSSTCGDGLVASNEACDDTNTATGDGCSDVCKVEPGFTCTGEPSVCS